MTPLAQRILREKTLPLARRTFNDQCGLLAKLDDFHCFEVTEIRELIRDFSGVLLTAERLADRHLMQMSYLPAARTWIEVAEPFGRCGVLLEYDSDDKNRVRLTFSLSCAGHFSSFAGGDAIRLSSDPSVMARTVLLASRQARRSGPDGMKMLPALLVLPALALINTPRVRSFARVHMPHAGLQRALARSAGLVGKFPLRAWTEMRVPVETRMVGTAGETREVRLTGERCYHWCKAFHRTRLGKTEFVTDHWRGNPALGIKQSRYVMTPPSLNRGAA